MRIIVVQSARLKLKTKGLKLSSMNQTLKYHTLIETCKNVGLNVKEYLTYVFSRPIECENDYEKLLPSSVAR
mgnify:CR=1 FL=1